MSEVKPKNVFRYINAINNNVNEVVEEDYNKFLTTRAFSYFVDTILIANEINQYPAIDNDLHYDFLKGMIPPKKRFTKWAKPVHHKEAALLSKYYGITQREAYLYVSFFSEDEFKEMQEVMGEDK